MATNKNLKILIVDDHDITRKGLAMLVSRQKDLSVVAEAGTVAGALEKARVCVPDIVIMDTRLPDGSGIEACRDILDENDNVKVLILTSYKEEAVMDSIMSGASGYLLKEVRSQEIVDAIRKVGSGQPLLDPAVTTNLLDQLGLWNEVDVLDQLTDQELKITELIAKGQTNSEIADEIDLNGKTVKDYVRSILGKLAAYRSL